MNYLFVGHTRKHNKKYFVITGTTRNLPKNDQYFLAFSCTDFVLCSLQGNYSAILKAKILIVQFLGNWHFIVQTSWRLAIVPGNLYKLLCMYQVPDTNKSEINFVAGQERKQHKHTQTHTYTYTHTLTHTHTFIYTYIHTHTHTHTHTMLICAVTGGEVHIL